MMGTLDESEADALLATVPDPATMKHVADALEVDYETVRTWVRTGKLKARKISGRRDGVSRVIDRAALRAFLTAPTWRMQCPQCEKSDRVTKRRSDRKLKPGDDDAVEPIKESFRCARCNVKFNRRISVEWAKSAD